MSKVVIPSPFISKLDLSNQGLTKFPEEILGLKNLKSLNLSNNRISIIPKEVIKLYRLETLDLANNEITQFYSKLCSLERLKRLNLNNNRIKSIPRQIKLLQKLTHLMLSNNDLKTLPIELQENKKLEEINISGNSFETIPYDVFNLDSLKSLWINRLNVTEFDLEKIKLGRNLKQVYSYGPKISSSEVSRNYITLSTIRGNSLPYLQKMIEENLHMSKASSGRPSKLLKKPTKKVNSQNIFISYAHADKTWLEKVQKHLKALENHNDIGFTVWDDTKINAGQNWKEEIKSALEKSGIAILLISTDFLASDFIKDEEVPKILQNAKEYGTKILPVIVEYSLFTKVDSVSIFQALNDPNKPLSCLATHEQNKILVDLALTVDKILKE
ncbi:leucine-rich repeat domain-containing protein [Flagellimonas marinaquae]|uniref:leucine-rich repeat domain-containing protein n=1 Tax=Flagellimonas marinaquae TaxID=254955 RepID=UPI0020758592|nr:TIR domain-containing protein [Allomuricauda aquimarina]USD26604.1 TIR domain-containing protein [Allomuricauda aquimarina]